ncbi:hypothetical protein ACFS5J_10735 [Flavobacterium chuncheonense]|uniref:Lysylphosphatidylglycerol synthase-like protein n=1 Tax=Flavobacterium chuncheonense TaxID=2026653 RepID=A0ABW5YN35_9FLAO
MSFLTVKTVVILLGFSALNWILEILKWQNLVSYFKTITFYEAAQQSLGSLTASIFTPNRIGEYGAKMLYFPKQNAKIIVLLNFISNTTQLIVTSLFGIIGLLNITTVFHSEIYLSLFIAFAIIMLLISLKNIELFGFSIQRLLLKIKQIPQTILKKNGIYSVVRYLVFSHQFYFLLFIFDCNLEYSTALFYIFSMYLLASIIPTIHFMDVAIKGSVALFLFSKLGIENWKIVTITSVMWLFNLVIPVSIGSYFVLRFKPVKA